MLHYTRSTTWISTASQKKLEVTSGCLKTKMNSYPAKL